MSFDMVFVIAVILSLVTPALFSVIAAVRAKKVKTGFVFWGFTAAMYVLTVAILYICAEVIGNLLALWISTVLSAIAVHAVTYKITLTRMFLNKDYYPESDWRTVKNRIERKKNLIFSIPYSVMVSCGVTSWVYFIGTIASLG